MQVSQGGVDGATAIAGGFHDRRLRNGLVRLLTPPDGCKALKYGLMRVFTPDDIAKMWYSPQTLEGLSKPSYREYRRRAVEELQQMADERALLLERGRTPEGADGYIILPPEGFGMPSMPMLEAG